MNTLGKRIRQWRVERGKSQGDVARHLGITRNSVSCWENGKNNPSNHNLAELSSFLNVPFEVLLNGSMPKSSFSGVRVRRQIPLISMVQAGRFAEAKDSYAAGEEVDFVMVSSRAGDHAFALEVAGDSMEPEFRAKDIVIIDPDAEPQTNDYVVAQLDDCSEATFKQYRPRGTDTNGRPVFDLVPLNPDHPTITINAQNPGRIIGRLTEAVRRY